MVFNMMWWENKLSKCTDAHYEHCLPARLLQWMYCTVPQQVCAYRLANSQGNGLILEANLLQEKGSWSVGEQTDNSLSTMVHRQGRDRGFGTGCLDVLLAKSMAAVAVNNTALLLTIIVVDCYWPFWQNRPKFHLMFVLLMGHACYPWDWTYCPRCKVCWGTAHTLIFWVWPQHTSLFSKGHS